MIHQFLEWIHTIGLPGLYLVMFIEGSALPFPGILMVLSFGYLFSPGYFETALIALGMSISYCLASLIPFYIGKRLERFIPKRFKKGLRKGQAFFNKYGIWSIAISRPFGIGNYIAYIAGISRVGIVKYLILTLVGIYPWSYVMIFLGNYFNGNIDEMMEFFHTYKYHAYLCILVVVALIVLFYYYKFKKEKEAIAELEIVSHERNIG